MVGVAASWLLAKTAHSKLLYACKNTSAMYADVEKALVCWHFLFYFTMHNMFWENDFLLDEPTLIWDSVCEDSESENFYFPPPTPLPDLQLPTWVWEYSVSSPIQIPGAETNSLECEKCNTTCISTEELVQHMQSIHHVGQFWCAGCGSVYKHKASLNRHKKSPKCAELQNEKTIRRIISMFN